MLGRTILMLLLAAFALPALANGPCHDAAPMHHAGHGLPRPEDRATVPHVCIGCIPPASLASGVAGFPPSIDRIPRIIVAADFTAGRTTPPALPPPRRTA